MKKKKNKYTKVISKNGIEYYRAPAKSKRPMILDGSKLAYHKDVVNTWLEGNSIVPITIDMALTRQCNMHCIYCYSTLQENERTPLTPKDIRNFMEDCAVLGVKGISLVSDGESTCHPYWAQSIEYGKGLGLAMALGTNGLLVSPRKAEEVLPHLSYLRFNISAGEAKRYAYIHGTNPLCFDLVVNNINEAIRIRNKNKYNCTIGMQMVLMPEFKNDIIPLATLAKKLGVDYLIIKHCSDDENGQLGVDYEKYKELEEVLKQAEGMSTQRTKIVVKWNKIKEGNVRQYERCYGAQFILQISGSGLVAPCGMLFGEKYKEYHIGNIGKQRFIDIVTGSRYKEVMDKLASEKFNAKTMCGFLCLQHYSNNYLHGLKENGVKKIRGAKGCKPMHWEFI